MTVTLTGGVNTSSLLYYSSTSSVGYIASALLDAHLISEYTLSQYQMDTTPSGSAGTDTYSTQPVLDISDGLTSITAANYSAIIDEAIGPILLDVTNSGGATSILAGSGGGRFNLDDNSSATIAAGDGSYWIGGKTDTGSLAVVLGNGNDTVNYMYGNATIGTGTGNTIVNLYQDTQDIVFAGPSGATPGLGADTINAGVGNENVTVTGYAGILVSENESFLTLTNGDAVSSIRGGGNTFGFDINGTVYTTVSGGGTVQGGTANTNSLGGNGGATTINAGGSGAVYWTGETYNFFLGGANAPTSTLYDQVTDNSNTNDTLVAGAGATSINAAGSSGNVLLETGTGDSTLIGGSGADTFEVAGLAEGSHTITIGNWSSSDTLELQGFAGLENISYATVSGGITATLTDGTVITFTGLTNSDQITHVTSV